MAAFSGLIELVYAAAVDASQWPVFLEALAEVIDGDGTALFAVDPDSPLRSVSAISRFDPELIDRYAREFATNIWTLRADQRFAPNEIRYSQGLTSNAELSRNRYQADFLSPADIVHALGLKIPFGSPIPAYLTSTRSGRQGPFEDPEGDVVLALAPHVGRALELHRRTAGSVAFAEALNLMPQGVLFAARSGAILWWNRHMESILTDNDGLSIRRGQLQTRAAGENETLGALVRRSGPDANPTDKGGSMSVSRPSLRRPYAVLVTPLSSAKFMPGAEVVIFVNDPEHSTTTGVEQLAAQFRLTTAEATLASSLVRGNSVAEAAQEMGIRITTARTHLRRLFLKTSTSRQSDLMRVLLSGPSRIE